MQDEEVFEINDFTDVTELERFSSSIESVLCDWEITGERYSVPSARKIAWKTVKWLRKVSKISYSSFNYDLYYFTSNIPETTVGELLRPHSDHASPTDTSSSSPTTTLDNRPIREILDATSDFISCMNDDIFCVGLGDNNHSAVVRWFGVKEFCLIIPVTKSDIITSETGRNVVISAANMALINSKCHVPVFVQVLKPWRQIYFGTCLNPNIRMTFDCLHLRDFPQRFSYLNGLIDLFKEKIAPSSIATNLPSVKVTVRLKFELDEGFESWSQLPPDIDSTSISSLGYAQLGHLPFGAAQDPVTLVYLFTTWPQGDESLLVENSDCSDLDVLQAPFWHLKFDFSESSQASCLLGELLGTFNKVAHITTSVRRVLAIEDSEPSDGLRKLAASGGEALPRIGSSSSVRSSPLSNKTRWPVSIEDINNYLDYCFVDSLELPTEKFESKLEISDDNLVKKPGQLVKEISPVDVDRSAAGADIINLSKMKVCPVHSLTWRMAECLMNTLNSQQFKESFSQLWHEIVGKLRNRWETGSPLPFVDQGAPDHGSCLFHQKLQMLNCCILHKLKRETDSLIEDEYFDAFEDDDLRDRDPPEGRLGYLDGESNMLGYPSRAIYIPQCQDSMPFTEDMLAEHTAILTSLGSTEEGSKKRAELQSSSLLSDMEAFKAANPGAQLPDFILWYSPRDWDPIERKLSERMLLPNNMWQQNWDFSKPVPITRQKRLFDDTKEAEKILHYFANISLSDAAKLLLPIVFTIAALGAVKEASSLKPWCQQLISACEDSMSSLTRISSPLDENARVNDVQSKICELEFFVARYRAIESRILEGAKQFDSLKSRPAETRNESSKFTLSFQEHRPFFVELMTGNPVLVPGAASGIIGNAIRGMFGKDSRVMEENKHSYDSYSSFRKLRFPPALDKEYILRWTVPRMIPNSRSLPHRMYASINKEKGCRLALSMMDDIVFSE